MLESIVSESNCADTMDSLAKVFNDQGKTASVVDMASPAGTYSKKNPPRESTSEVWGTRRTANNKYTDDVAFDKVSEKDGKCTIMGKSYSQSVSYYDYNVNFCNIYNGLRIATRDSAVQFNLDAMKPVSCKYALAPSEYATCNRY